MPVVGVDFHDVAGLLVARLVARSVTYVQKAFGVCEALEVRLGHVVVALRCGQSLGHKGLTNCGKVFQDSARASKILAAILSVMIPG